MNTRTPGGPPPKSHAHLDAKGWAVNPRYYENQGKKPFLSFLLATEASGTHQVKVFGEPAKRFKDLNEGEPLSVTARARRVPVMDGDKQVTNSRDRKVYDTEFLVDEEFGKIDDAGDLGAKPERQAEEAEVETDRGGRARQPANTGSGGRQRPAAEAPRQQRRAGRG